MAKSGAESAEGEDAGWGQIKLLEGIDETRGRHDSVAVSLRIPRYGHIRTRNAAPAHSVQGLSWAFRCSGTLCFPHTRRRAYDAGHAPNLRSSKLRRDQQQKKLSEKFTFPLLRFSTCVSEP